ncbi:MAG TPA: GNAT family N-acetyltransferase [Ruminiclostridium sp.]|nr:GNAT family N-acetyltransferase [Ruminiclostridium sp.]
MLIKYDSKYDAEIIELWNKAATKDGYKELDYKSFNMIFSGNKYFSQDNSFILDINGVKGFACGCTGDDLPLGDKAGYITSIILDKEFENRENFRELLDCLEAAFINEGKLQSEVLFFNPMLLPWYIPDTPKHEHNNAPGAFVGSFFHRGLLENGYAERTHECAMYLDLSTFEIPESIQEKEKMANEAGYDVTLYDNSKHTGIEEMLQGFDNILWQREISECTRKGIPVVIAAYEGKAVGFAGPVIRQESGRGYFAGIGVNSEHEGHGLGSILFFKLCEAFVKVGADYMSLYTGVDNPAKNIYVKAGFREVMKFAIMRKQL